NVSNDDHATVTPQEGAADRQAAYDPSADGTIEERLRRHIREGEILADEVEEAHANGSKVCDETIGMVETYSSRWGSLEYRLADREPSPPTPDIKSIRKVFKVRFDDLKGFWYVRGEVEIAPFESQEAAQLWGRSQKKIWEPRKTQAEALLEVIK